MQEKKVIGIIIFAYILAMIGMYYGVDSYIDKKDSRLFHEINNKLDLIFSQKKGYADIEYSDAWPEFKEAEIPRDPQKWYDLIRKESLTDSEKNEIDSWKEDFGDLASLYLLNGKEGKDGWNIVFLMRNDYGISISHVFPYAIGFRKHDEFPSSNPVRPRSSYVQDCLRKALEFETTNPQSSYYKYFKEGSFSKKWSEIENAANEYYCVSKDDYPRLKLEGKSILDLFGAGTVNYSKDIGAVQSEDVINFSWKVFLAISLSNSFSVSRRFPGQVMKDKKLLWTIWGVILSILMLGAVIPLSVINRQRERKLNENLYDKLLRLCNPANFINGDNYDKLIVDKANDIYKRLTSISNNDIISINAIQAEAVSELGIKLVDKEKIEYLKDLADPRNYLKPYDPDKFALANDLFAILSKDDISYEELAEVEERIKTLR